VPLDITDEYWQWREAIAYYAQQTGGGHEVLDRLLRSKDAAPAEIVRALFDYLRSLPSPKRGRARFTPDEARAIRRFYDDLRAPRSKGGRAYNDARARSELAHLCAASVETIYDVIHVRKAYAPRQSRTKSQKAPD